MWWAQENHIKRSTTILDKLLVETPRCCVCGKTGTMMVSHSGWRMYLSNKLAQESFPDLSNEQREQLITGTHPECWDKLFDGEEE